METKTKTKSNARSGLSAYAFNEMIISSATTNGSLRTKHRRYELKHRFSVIIKTSNDIWIDLVFNSTVLQKFF